MNVIIADDSVYICKNITDLISNLDDINVTGLAHDFPTVLELLDQQNPDVLVLDVKMPGGNVIDVVKSIKQLENPPIVIVFTFYPYQQYRIRTMEAGADYFFDKVKDIIKLEETLVELRDEKLASMEPETTDVE